MKKTKWLIYTVLVGLIPISIRLIIYLISNDRPFEYVMNEVDIVTFGLILHLTNINELDDCKDFEPNIKITFMGLSIVFLVIFAAFLGITYFSENLPNGGNINKMKMKYLSIIMAIASFFMSFSIYYRLSKLAISSVPQQDNE